MLASKGLGKVLLVALVIPVIGFAVSYWILNDLNSQAAAEEMPTVQVICESVAGMQDVDPEVKSACAEVAHVILLQKASIVSAAIGISIPLLYWFAAMFGGENRRRIASVFPAVLRISIGLIAATVLLQGAILTYAVYVGESYATGRVHFFIVGAIALGALVAGLQLVTAAVRLGGKLEMTATGKVLTASDAPRLFDFVRSMASKLGAKAPQNIIVGLEPTFYVTSCDINVPEHGKTVKGETLYISAPLSRLMSREEFSSVLGHELGHFKGDDTAYSMRFAPVYAGLGSAISAVAGNEDEGAAGLAKIPAMVMLAYMHDTFATNAAKISRDREHKADQVGAEAGSPTALATALIKVSLYGGLWNHARQRNVERLNNGKIAENLSAVFSDTARYDVQHEALEDIMRPALEKSTPHPTDSHPPISQRLEALNVDARSISKEMLLVPTQTAIDLIDNFQAIEREATVAEHRLMVAHGVAKLPEEPKRNNLLHATYSLAASLVGADGSVDPREVAVAEEIGRRLFDDFDDIEFREYCNNSDRLLDVVKVSEAMGSILEVEHRDLVMKYLREIAAADGTVSAEEEALLQQVERGLEAGKISVGEG